MSVYLQNREGLIGENQDVAERTENNRDVRAPDILPEPVAAMFRVAQLASEERGPAAMSPQYTPIASLFNDSAVVLVASRVDNLFVEVLRGPQLPTPPSAANIDVSQPLPFNG